MVISSRTPEGDDNRCSVCGNALKLEPSRPPGDAPCPHCGVLLWFPSAAVERPMTPMPDSVRSKTGRTGNRIVARLWRAVQSARRGT
jgi:hypothetical protein